MNEPGLRWLRNIDDLVTGKEYILLDVRNAEEHLCEAGYIDLLNGPTTVEFYRLFKNGKNMFCVMTQDDMRRGNYMVCEVCALLPE